MCSDPTDTTRVLYLAGWGRSGSTLAESLLDQVPGLVGVGEIKFLWERGLQQNRRCSCGTPLRSCDFWVDVLTEAFGGIPDDAEVHRLDAASRRFRTRHLPGLLLRPGAAPDPDGLGWYYAALRRLYAAVAAVSGARTVVDSSKFPSYLTALLQTPGLDLRVAHIVRDPRAAPMTATLPRWTVFNGSSTSSSRPGRRTGCRSPSTATACRWPRSWPGPASRRARSSTRSRWARR